MSCRSRNVSSISLSGYNSNDVKNECVELKSLKEKNGLENIGVRKKILSRKPINSDLRQQRISTCIVIYYPGRTSVIFLCFSFIYLFIAVECDLEKLIQYLIHSIYKSLYKLINNF